MSPQMWEKAIELGKQLAKMHESHMFDFMELSQLLVRGYVHCNSVLHNTNTVSPKALKYPWKHGYENNLNANDFIVPACFMLLK